MIKIKEHTQITDYSRDIGFHFNKKFLEDSSIPMWVIKCKGETYYVDHLNSQVGFTTKETPDNNSTKGSLKFKGKLSIIEYDNGNKEALIE